MNQTNETQSLKGTNEKSSSIREEKSFPCLWYCCCLTPIMIMTLLIFIVSPLIVMDIMNDKDYYHDKNITIINKVWKNNTEEIICTEYNPCYLTCEDYNYQSDECKDNHTLQIIGLTIIGLFTLVCVCQIFKLIIGYICFKCSKKEVSYGRV